MTWALVQPWKRAHLTLLGLSGFDGPLRAPAAPMVAMPLTQPAVIPVCENTYLERPAGIVLALKFWRIGEQMYCTLLSNIE